MDMNLDKNYEDLANAIIMQAIRDLRRVNRQLQKPQKSETDTVELREKYDELMNFFNSDWLQMLTTVDKGLLIEYALSGAEGNGEKNNSQ